MLKSNVEKLWGGVLRNFQHDIGDHTASFEVYVEDLGERASFKIHCAGIQELHFSYPAETAAWNYIELTSIEVDKGTSAFVVECELWSSESTMKIVCSEFSLSRLRAEGDSSD